VGSSLGRQPRRLMKLRSFCRGFAVGATVPVNKNTGLYIGDPAASKAETDRQPQMS
jgi:hypothetical protein